MNKILGTIIGAVCGAALGGGIAYVYLNKKYDKVFEIEMEANDDIIRDLKEENASLHKRLVEKQNEAKDKFFKNESIVEAPNDVLEEDEEDDEEDDEEFDIDRVDPDDNSEIRFISFRDYEDDDDYEKEELKYYMADGVFTQDEEVLDISEFTNICGQNAAIVLKNPSTLSRYSGGGDNELYVRNEEYSTDYKIKRYKISYQKYINSQR